MPYVTSFNHTHTFCLQFSAITERNFRYIRADCSRSHNALSDCKINTKDRKAIGLEISRSCLIHKTTFNSPALIVLISLSYRKNSTSCCTLEKLSASYLLHSTGELKAIHAGSYSFVSAQPCERPRFMPVWVRISFIDINWRERSICERLHSGNRARTLFCIRIRPRERETFNVFLSSIR